MVSYTLCGDCIQITLDLLWWFCIQYWVLNNWYQSTFLAQTLWANIFDFWIFFFGVEKRGPRHSQNFRYISMQNLQKRVVYMISSHKNTQFSKKHRLKRSLGSQYIEVLKSANFQDFFRGRQREFFYLYSIWRPNLPK